MSTERPSIRPRLCRSFARAAIVVLFGLATSSDAAEKALILHNLGGTYAVPKYLADHKAYVDTLPFDGIAVYVMDESFQNNVSWRILTPTPVSTQTISSLLAPVSGWQGGNLRRNFALMYIGRGTNAWDDAAWTVIAQNAANFAQAVKAAGMTGIFLDNENYADYGDWRPGSPVADANLHGLVESQTKMRARGRQVMQAIMGAFPEVVVLFFHDPYVCDETFYERHPRFNNVAHANELVGPFSVGFIEAKSASATVVLGGEYDFSSKTPAEFDEIYRYQHDGIVSEEGVPADSKSRASGANGYIPAALRPAWSSKVSGGAAIYEPDNHDASGNPTTITSTIVNAMARVDQYAWLYMEVSGEPPRPYADMLSPPGSTAFAAKQSWVDAVREGVRLARLAAAAPPAAPTITPAGGSYAGPVIITLSSQAAGSTIRYTLDGSDPTSSSTAYVGPFPLTASATLAAAVFVTGTSPSVAARATFEISPATASTVWVSDLPWTAAANGWGPAERDRANGESGTGDGAGITLAGVRYTKGIGVHAASDVRVSLGGRYARFTSDVGVDDEVSSRGSIVFQIWLDGGKVYDSGTMTGASPTKRVSVDTTGRSELRLVVTDAGDGIGSDHGDWAAARLERAAAVTYLSDLPWTTVSNGWGPAERDRSNAEQAAADGRAITIGGASFAKGIGAHATSDLRWALGRRYSRFDASIGVDDEVGNSGTVVFQVWLDGIKAFDSGAVGGADPARAVSLDVAGADQLRLVVTNAGDDDHFDHADWAAARLTLASSVWLSDRAWTSAANGWGAPERDRSNGEMAASDGRTISIAGATYAKGLGVHAVSDLRYALGGGFARFISDIGVDDEVGDRGSVVFQVWLDGAKAFDSGTMTGADPSRAVSIDLVGRNELRLVVTAGSDNSWYDHADWAGARLISNAAGGAMASVIIEGVEDGPTIAGDGPRSEPGAAAGSRGCGMGSGMAALALMLFTCSRLRFRQV
jgi:hypothetical protein